MFWSCTAAVHTDCLDHQIALQFYVNVMLIVSVKSQLDQKFV